MARFSTLPHLGLLALLCVQALANPPLKKIPAPQGEFPPSDFDSPPSSSASLSVEQAAKVVAREFGKTEQRLQSLLENDGEWFNGQLTLKALSAMELDSSPAVRLLAKLPQSQWSRTSRLAVSVSYLDIYDAGQLRRCVIAFVKQSLLDFENLGSGGSLHDRDFLFRNRVAFVIHFLDKQAAILERAHSQEKISQAHFQPLLDSIVTTRRSLIESIVALQDFALAYEKLGEKGKPHTLWFAQASQAAAKGPAFVGIYERTKADGYRYLGHSQAIVTEPTRR